MAAYIIANVKVNDPVKYETYKQLASEAIRAHGGRYLVRGGPFEVMEGDWQPDRLVILEFPTLAQARTFYHSQDYVAARAARAEAGVMRLVMVEGL